MEPLWEAEQQSLAWRELQRRAHYRLKFCEPLEEAYREAFQHMARALRFFLGILMLLLYLASPLVDAWVSHR